MFVDRELNWKNTQDVMRIEAAKVVLNSPGATIWDHTALLDAEKAAEASSQALLERARQVEAGRSRVAVARLQAEHDRQWYESSCTH